MNDERDNRGAAGSTRPLRLGVLFSGTGRTLDNIAEQVRQGNLAAEVVVAISSHVGAGGLDRAARFGIPSVVLDYREWGDRLSDEIIRCLDNHRVDLVVLAGFIRHLKFPERYESRILNIHPALLPSFGGKGFYGGRVHRAVIDSGATESGCTVHFVTDEYDKGPIILQKKVPVLPGDTPETLAKRVFEAECAAYPEAIQMIAAGKVRVESGRVMVEG